jgi:hypothetical protein
MSNPRPVQWSIVVGFVLLGVGVSLLLTGTLVPDAGKLVDFGWTITGTGIGALTSKGIDAVQGNVVTPR